MHRHVFNFRVTLFVSLVSFVGLVSAAEDRDDPATELASFKLAPGFEVNLWADEKDGVVKPIQMRWDERGRLWVIGSKTYPQIKPGEEPNDEVIILEDTDGDGRADKTTVFADGLMIPTGLEIAPPGVLSNQSSVLSKTPAANAPLSTEHLALSTSASACYIGEGPKLWLMTDTDGDGKADKREVVLRGFGTGDNHQNINSFRWSPGGELVFCQGLHANSRVETPWGITRLDQAGIFRFRPREQRLDGFFGGPNDPQNPWGWTFTKWGQPIINAGNSGGFYFAGPELIRGWQGGRRDPILLQGRGRKTSNPEIIESAHFPDEWQGLLLPGGYINNSVWTLRVEQDGSGFKINDDTTLPPLIQSTHGSFRPIDVRLGPDGALYLADWYNPIIGHYQASFRHPDRDKVHGRIWRITAKGRPLLQAPKIAGADVLDLFELMRATDRYPREQAKRVLFGGDTAAITSALRTWCERLDPNAPDLDFALMQALGVFEAHETVDIPLVKRVLAAKTPEARAYAANTLARWADRLPLTFDPLEQLSALALDPDPRVRLAAIVAAGNIPRAESIVVVLNAAEKERDKFIDTALYAAVAVLKPRWTMWVEGGVPDVWKPQWSALLRSLDKPRPAPPVSKPALQKKGAPVVPIYGRLRASPFVTANIAAEVLTKGDPKHGAEVFRRPELICTTCHRIGDEGGQVGPALDAIGSAQPLEFLIGTVIEPQREVKEGFETVKLTTKKGEVIIGIIAAGNASELVLRDPGGLEHTVAQTDIASREMIGSLMPAGLTDNLSTEDLRDLFAYLTQLGKAK
jgi:putative heme-binding domain-containing protein